MELEHVHDPYVGDSAGEEVRPLVQACPHEKPSVAAALNRKFIRVAESLIHEVLPTGLKVVEYILLAELRTGLVPFLAVFTPASAIRDCHDSAKAQDVREPGRGERRGE